MRKVSGVVSLLCVLAAGRAGVAGTPQGGPSAGDPSALVESVGERVQSYYDHLTTIACTETVIEPITHDVLQLETRLAEPFRAMRPHFSKLPNGLWFHTIERWEMVVHFRHVAFDDPVDDLLLPESIVTVSSITDTDRPRMKTT